MSQLIYIASPYSHPNRSVRVDRFDAVCLYAAQLMSDGLHVFSPIAHTHPIAEAGDLPKGFDYWREYDEMMIGFCSVIHVLKLDGWENSVGVIAEVRFAFEHGIEVVFVDPETNQSPLQSPANNQAPPENMWDAYIGGVSNRIEVLNEILRHADAGIVSIGETVELKM